MHIAAVEWFMFLNGLSFCWSFLSAPSSPAGLRVSSTPLTSASDSQLNRARMRIAVTPDPALRELVDDVVRAQSAQLAGLEAQRAYLETGNREHLNGADGVRERRIAASQAIQAFQEHQQTYLNKSGFVVRPTQPKP